MNNSLIGFARGGGGLVAVCLAAGCGFGGLKAEAAGEPSASGFDKYRFDKKISREVLENYLSRSITMEGLLNGRGDLEDNIRMLKSIGAKFIGRSLCLWGGEANLLRNLERARQQAPKVHAADPEMILQACIFEIVTTQVEQVPVPDWAFAALGQPVEKRNFRYADMLYPDERFKDHWRTGQSVPDVSRPETRLWFYFLGASFIDVGCEAIHCGQTELMNRKDRNLDNYAQVLGLIRSYAARHARRHIVLCDSHVPSGGLVREGQLLMDFHSFPLRIMEVPDKPQEAILKVGFSDGIYGRSKGGETFSGWQCEHLPYLVELDNWGVSRQPGQAKAGGIWIWGYDEITWFAHQSQQYRSNWLSYAWDWVRRTDANGHLEMPGSRTMSSPLDYKRWYYANAPSPAVPDGLGDEEAIRAIWAADAPALPKQRDMPLRQPAQSVVVESTVNPTNLQPDISPNPFTGAKSLWHGFDRYDFLMDEENLAIKPADEKVKGEVAGQRRCIVVVPKAAAPGNPWSWRGCYWDHEPQAEIELLKRGFHIAYITANASLKPDRKWDAWYEFLTEKHGLSRKPTFIGMSRGGEYAYTWATAHPDKVSCIYADNPGGNPELFRRLGDLARNDVPLLQVCGSIDPLLGKNALAIESIYQQFGGRITMMIKEGAGHHPHSLRDPEPIADFITQSVQPRTVTPPAFAAGRFTRTTYYSVENFYRDFTAEGTRITCRGPGFTECYDRYAFEQGGVEGSIDVIVPRTAAPGKPWVFRVGFVDRDAVVDLGLLARGFHIVTGPVPYNADGPRRAHWDAVYQHLTNHGFSSKPVMEGAGGAAGEVFAWAIENPDKVSCIYAENPILRSKMSKTPPLDNLAPLAKAGVPLLHVCGSLDPGLDTQTRVVERRYKELGGQITVIVKEGEGHYPLAPKDAKPVLDFIARCVP